MLDYETHSLGDFALQSGQTLPGAWIAYKTFGEPSSPAVLYPSWYSGLISDNEWLIGEDKTLNPKKYFIVITALFGNSQSISPSNSKIAPFPDVTFYDNVRAQHDLLTKGLRVKHLRAVTGWSMGAGQSFQWATQYPVSLMILPLVPLLSGILLTSRGLHGYLRTVLWEREDFSPQSSDAGRCQIDSDGCEGDFVGWQCQWQS